MYGDKTSHYTRDVVAGISGILSEDGRRKLFTFVILTPTVSGSSKVALKKCKNHAKSPAMYFPNLLFRSYFISISRTGACLWVMDPGHALKMFPHALKVSNHEEEVCTIFSYSWAVDYFGYLEQCPIQFFTYSPLGILHLEDGWNHMVRSMILHFFHTNVTTTGSQGRPCSHRKGLKVIQILCYHYCWKSSEIIQYILWSLLSKDFMQQDFAESQ